MTRNDPAREGDTPATPATPATPEPTEGFEASETHEASAFSESLGAADLDAAADDLATADAVDIVPPAAATSTALSAPISPPAAALRARVRWAGIVWGLVFAAVAVAGISFASAPGRAEALAAWVKEISAVAAIGYGVAVVGVLLLVTGVVGLLRRAQRSLAARRGA